MLYLTLSGFQICALSIVSVDFFFFFQAEDGIRDLTVTGVQTCALPICLAGLPVADDQLPLATPDGDHRVDGLDPGLQGLAHGLALDHPGRPDLHTAELLGRDRPFAVQRGADRVDDPPDDGLPDGDFRNPARPLDQIPLLDMLVGAQDHRTDVVLFQVERDPLEAAGELQQLAGHRPVQSVDLGDAVPDLEHGADFGHVYLLLEGLHLLSDD